MNKAIKLRGDHKETLNLCGDIKSSEFTLRQYLYRQKATLHGLEERTFKELPKIVYWICERLLKLCGCQNSAGLDFRVRNRPFYKNFLVFKLRETKPSDPTTPEEVSGEQVTVPTLPMIEWRDPIDEDIQRNLETVSRLTGAATSNDTMPALDIHEAFVSDHKYLPEEKQKYMKQLRNEINQRREGFARIDKEEDPIILTGLLFEWLEGLKQPILDREDLSTIVGRARNVETCIQAMQREDIMLIEYLLHFVNRLRPVSSAKKIEIIKRLLASLTHLCVPINGKTLPNKDLPKIREGTCSQIVNFMLRMIVEMQKDIVKPGRDDSDVVVPYRRMRIKAWK